MPFSALICWLVSCLFLEGYGGAKKTWDLATPLRDSQNRCKIASFKNYHICFVRVTRPSGQYLATWPLCLILRQSQLYGTHYSRFLRLDLGLWRRKLPRHDSVLETRRVVRPVAKRLVGGMPAAAQPNRRSPGQPKRVPLRVHNLKIAIHADGSVIANRYFCRSHIRPWSASLFGINISAPKDPPDPTTPEYHP